MKKNVLKKMVLLMALGFSASAFADDVPSVSFSGFGTLGVVHNSNSNIDFVSNSRQPSGAGQSSSVSIDPDSLIAGQMNAKLTSSVSAVVQVISQHQYDNTFRPNVEWAFVKWQVTPSWDVAAGRSAIPTFALSDSRLVGYSSLWVRPPVDVYYQVPLTYLDGLSTNWHKEWAGGDLSVQGNFGSTSLKFPGQTKVKGNKTFAGAITFEKEALSYRVGYTSTELTFNAPGVDALTSGFQQYGGALSSVGFNDLSQEAFNAAKNFEINGKRVSFIDVGVVYDKGSVIAQAEWTKRKGVSYIADTEAWYVSGGYRMGSWTPYAVYSSVKTTNNLNNPVKVTGGNSTADQLNQGAQWALASSGVAQKTISAGLKWNVRSNMDLKLQWDHVIFKQGTAGTFNNPNAVKGLTTANVGSLALDFVF